MSRPIAASIVLYTAGTTNSWRRDVSHRRWTERTELVGHSTDAGGSIGSGSGDLKGCRGDSPSEDCDCAEAVSMYP